MKEFRNRPKGEFLMEAKWEELYALTQHWRSDLEFYSEDIDFLNRLVDKYFIWINDERNIASVREIQDNLRRIRIKCRDLLDKTQKHLNQIGSLIEEESADSRIFRLEHEHLEGEIADFVKAFRENRREVFKITEYIVENEQLSDFLK